MAPPTVTASPASTRRDGLALDDDAADGGGPARRAVTLRSVLVGLLGVVFICGLTPYNDYAMASTFVVGNFLPVGLLLFFLVVILLVNAPLLRLAPRLALGGGELAVAFGMVLLSCTLPSSGLMRYLPASIVGLHYQASTNADYREVLEEVDLPDWLLPTFAGDTIVGRANEAAVANYRGRTPGVGDGWADAIAAVPWRAWLTPALTWGVFLAGLYGAVLCLSVIVRRQWVENERLAFPLAGVFLSILEPPAPGRALNGLFRSTGFWIAAGAVFAVHSTNALYQYQPKVPEIPIGYDFNAVFADSPLRFTESSFKAATIYFSMIGITFFLQSKVSFSLWGFYLIYNVAHVNYRSLGAELTAAMRIDQQFGAILVYAAAAVWVGRAEWAMVARQMARGARPDEPAGRYLPYAAAGWGFVACAALMVGWLVAAGSTAVGAVVLVAMLLLLLLAIARVVAETGLIFVQFLVPLMRPWTYALTALPTPVRTGARTLFYTAWFHQILGSDMREASSVYATHALRVADDAAYPWARSWRAAAPFLACLALALAVGYVVAGASTLFVEYNHATPLGVGADGILNPYGVDTSTQGNVLNPVREHLPPRLGPNDNHSRLGHFAFGAGFLGLLSYLRLRFDFWPFHPVGFLLAPTYAMGRIWLSVLVGWLAKVLIVRFGGARLLRDAKPVFLGLIVGETGAAAVWLLVSLLLNAGGYEFRPINLLPT